MKVRIRIGDAVLYKNYLYFSNSSSNGLYRINAHSKDVEFVDYFPDEKKDAVLLHKKVFFYKNKIIFIPSLSRYIVIYDFERNSFERVYFENDIDGEAVLDAFQVDNRIFLFKRNTEFDVVLFELETMHLSTIDCSSLQSSINDYTSHENPDKFYRAFFSDGCFYFGLCESDIIAIWNIENNRTVILHTGNEKIINIYKIGENIYYTTRDKYGLGVINKDMNISTFIDVEKTDRADGNIYGCLFPINDYIVAAPAFGKYIHAFRDGKLELEYLVNNKTPNNYKFYRYLNVDSDIWMLPIDTEEIHVLKGDTLELERYPIELKGSVNRNIAEGIIADKVMEREILYESADLGLIDFLGFIKES